MIFNVSIELASVEHARHVQKARCELTEGQMHLMDSFWRPLLIFVVHLHQVTHLSSSVLYVFLCFLGGNLCIWPDTEHESVEFFSAGFPLLHATMRLGFHRETKQRNIIAVLSDHMPYSNDEEICSSHNNGPFPRVMTIMTCCTVHHDTLLPRSEYVIYFPLNLAQLHRSRYSFPIWVMKAEPRVYTGTKIKM